MSAYPNPFNPATTIWVNLPTQEYVTLRVFDMLGREINEIHSGLLTEGAHQIVWNGTDSKNRQVSSGIYLVRLEAAGRLLSHRVMYAK
jgi:flagellar hook assembly protein FlgD